MSQILVSEKNRSNIPVNILIERQMIKEKLDELRNLSPFLLRKYIKHLYVNESARSVNINTAYRYTREIMKFLNWLINNNEVNKETIKDISKDDFNNIDNEIIQEYLDSCGSYIETNEKGDRILHSNSIRTISFKKTALKGFFTWLYKNEYIERNETEKLRRITTPNLPPIIVLTDEEVNAMLELCKTGKTSIYGSTIELSKKEMETHELTKYRDLAILSLFVYHGLRIHELRHLNLNSLFFEKNYFEIYRKRNKKSIMYFSKQSKLALKEYLEYERPTDKVLPEDKNAVFISTREYRRLSLRQIRRIVKKYAVKVSGNSKISPHKLRATLATKALRMTGNIYDVQQILDHSSPNTTQRYLLADEEAKKKIAGIITYDKLNEN